METAKKPTFEEVYEEYYDKIYKSVYIRLLNRENTEDIVQEIFIKAMRAYDRYDPSIASLSTWLNTIATNALYDHFRKNKRSDKIISLDEYMEAGCEPGSDDKELEQLTDGYAGRAYEILKHLNDSEKELIMMHYGLELTYPEMAKLLTSNDKAVGRRMQRLIRKCQKIAEENNI